MSLQVEIPAGDAESRFAASEVALERGLGQPVTWRLLVRCTHDDPRLPFLAESLEGGQLKVSPVWKESPLGLEGIVVSVRWSARLREHLEIEAHVTTLASAPSPAPDPDPFTPRWRVHDKVQNLLKLAQRFAHVATLPNWVKTPLEKVKFTPDDYTSVLQDGLSDWAFLCHVLDQYGVLGAEAALKPLVLLGSVEEAPGKWLVTFGSKAAFDKLGDISNREIEPAETTLQGVTFDLRNDLADGNSVIVPIARRQWRKRKFTPEDWEKWIGKDLPLFTKGDQRFVHRIVDKIWPSDTVDAGLQWTTELDPLPEGAVVAGPEPPVPLTPWIRIGEVSETKPKGPWIKVKLEGFESGSETIQARLSSPYGGTDGKKGLHLVPENTTKVVLSWSGRFHEPLLVLGNVRDAEVEHPSPSLWLEALATEQYADILVKQVGKTTVESDLEMEFKKATTMKSTGALKLTGEDTTTIESTKAFKLDAKDAADIAATGAVTIEAKQDAKVAGMNVTLEAKTGATVKGNSTAELSSTGQTTVKGNPVMIN